MIPEDDLAAIAAALALLSNQPAQPSPEPQRRSRWKLAERRPDLEIEEIRVLH